MLSFKKSSKGFTLVELLVVIAIIGTLATLLLLQLGVARAKARDAKRIADINQLHSASELYFDDNGGHYPVITDLASCITMLGKYLTAPACPSDPVTGVAYKYAYDPASNPTRYQWWIELEGTSNAVKGDADINSLAGGSGYAAFSSGNKIDGSQEACAAAYNAGAATDCVYDVGQK